MSVRVPGATVSDDALLSIVRGAVGRVAGARIDTPGRVARVLPGRRNPVEWQAGDASISFDVDIAAGYGRMLPQTAAAVRSAICAAVEQMTGLRVLAVDITVTGLDREEEGQR